MPEQQVGPDRQAVARQARPRTSMRAQLVGERQALVMEHGGPRARVVLRSSLGVGVADPATCDGGVRLSVVMRSRVRRTPARRHRAASVQTAI